MRRVAILALFVIAAGPVLAVADSVELTDQAGLLVSIDQPVDRVASVYGLGTYFLYALGAQDRLVGGGYVGVKNVAQASEVLRRLEPRLDDLFLYGDPNIEEILRRDPQLILVDGSRHAAFAEQMSSLGVPVIRYFVETPEALLDALELTGLALGPEAVTRAETFALDLGRVFDSIANDLSALEEDERVRVLFLGTAPLQVASGEMYQTDLIEAAGGASVSAELFGGWNEVNLEQILLWNPDVILIPPYGQVQPSDLLGSSDWLAIAAVCGGRVHRMPRLIAPMDTPVPESLVGVIWMASVFYPDLVTLDLGAEAERFYSTFYELDLTDADLALLLAE